MSDNPNQKSKLNGKLDKAAAMLAAEQSAIDAGILPERTSTVMDLAREANRSVAVAGGVYVPNDVARELATSLSFAGYSIDQVAEILRLPAETVRLHYGHDAQHGWALQMAELANSAWRRAMAGDSDLTKFILANKMGWGKAREKSEGREGEPEQLSTKERAQLIGDIVELLADKRVQEKTINGTAVEVASSPFDKTINKQ